MTSNRKQGRRGSPGHFGIYGQRGVLWEDVLTVMLEAARSARSQWMMRPLHKQKELWDPDLQGLATVEWPLGPMPADRPLPILNLSNSAGRREGIGNLLSDDPAVGRLAADFFHQKDVRSLLVLGIGGHTGHEERFCGAIERAHALGMTVRSFQLDFTGARPEADGSPNYTEWFRDQLFPVLHALPLGAGVFCTNDWLAIQILLLLHRHFPEHLDGSSVLGVDNDAENKSYHGVQLPSLSSIQPAFPDMGREAFRWLSAHPGRAGAESMAELYRRFPPLRVVERASTSAGACADPLTARMIRWAWDRVQREEKVSVTTMARAHHMHVKSLERRFQQHTGGNAVNLLARLKLNRAKSLLRETTLPIAEVASRSGYSKQDVLSRALRAAEGCTPREFRNRAPRQAG